MYAFMQTIFAVIFFLSLVDFHIFWQVTNENKYIFSVPKQFEKMVTDGKLDNNSNNEQR